MRLPLTIIVLVMSLTSCALWQTVNNLISPPRLPLSQPIGPERRVLLQMTFDKDDLHQKLLIALELDAHHIAMAGLTQDGLSLFNLNYDGTTLLFEQSPLMHNAIAPETLLNDLQLAYWPITALAKQTQAPWRLDAKHNERNLYYNNEKQASITYIVNSETWPTKLDLINYPNNYHLHIDTLSNELSPVINNMAPAVD